MSAASAEVKDVVKPKRTNVLMSVAAVAVFAIILVGIFKYLGGLPDMLKLSQQSSASPAPVKLLTRAQFEYRIYEKSRAEVKEIMGTPDTTQQSGSSEFWYYSNRTYDEITNKPDRLAQVVFHHGIVDRVNF